MYLIDTNVFLEVLLTQEKREDAFQKFVSDIFPNIEIVTLSKWSYDSLVEIKKKSGLDFDDAYQYKIAKEHDLKLITMDTDFEEITDIDVIFL